MTHADIPYEMFEAAFARFLERAHEVVNSHPATRGSTLGVSRRSKKYVKVIRISKGAWGEEAYCFINKQTGAVLRPKSWSTPHPTPRGNILTPDDYGIEWHGPKRLRGEMK